ncbi:MAG: helix-turn-helix transcriptional regulator [Deltaproteobacteria bacterium]|nr:helix-turn-helix transcriptional regulator [Deltaproteobacteria bacterium]
MGRSDVDQARGVRLRDAREAAGKTIAQAADAIGARWHTVKRYEQGMAPSPERLVLLAQFYGTTAERLMGQDGAAGAPAVAHVEAELPVIFAAFYASPIGADTTDEEKQRLQDRRWREGLELTLEDLFSFRTMIRNAKKRGLPPLTEQEQELERTRIAKGRPRNVLVGDGKSPPPPRPRTKPRPKR